MSEKPESFDQKRAHQAAQDYPPNPQAVRDALLRLRQLAANLPRVDAVALVRDGRDVEQNIGR